MVRTSSRRNTDSKKTRRRRYISSLLLHLESADLEEEMNDRD